MCKIRIENLCCPLSKEGEIENIYTSGEIQVNGLISFSSDILSLGNEAILRKNIRRTSSCSHFLQQKSYKRNQRCEEIDTTCFMHSNANMM
jgi:hypothetical protein